MVKNILITGSDGFVGKNLVNFYKDKYNILTLKKNDDIDSVLSKSPDFIINTAASIYDYNSMFNTNIILVNKLIEYVKVYKTKLIQIGSSAEYGKKNLPSKESDFLAPLTFYAGTKAAATMMCQSAAIEFDLPILIARPYSLFGNYEKSYRLFTRLYEAFTQNIEMTLTQAYHDFIYIKDFISGIDNLLNCSNYINGDIINFGSGIQTSNFEVFELFVKIFAFKPECINIKNDIVKSFEHHTWICDTSYAFEKYNFKTKYSLEDGIKDLLKTKGSI